MTDFDALLKRAKERYDAMSPEEQAAMWDAQRKSFVRAMTTPCEHGVLEFEDCKDCQMGAVKALEGGK